jgi:hypothetical protein
MLIESGMIGGLYNILFLLKKNIIYVNGYVVINKNLPIFQSDIISFKVN